MAAGALRELVAFERQGEVDDGYGNPVSGPFAEQFRCAGRLRPLKGGEAVLASRLQGTQPMLVTVRYSSDTAAVTPEWRARDARSGAIYNIRSIANTDEKRAYLDMMCEAGVAA